MRTPVVVSVLVLVAGCSSGDDEPLRDAAEVNAQRAAANATLLDFGDTAEHEGVSVTIGSATWEGRGDGSGRAFTMEVVFENRSDTDEPIGPLVTIHCANSDEYFNQSDGPVDPLAPLPAGTRAAGTASGRAPVWPCEDAWLQWEPLPLGAPTFRWPGPTD